MRKTDRKTENLLRGALTEACEMALEKHEGFMWLTHLANFQDFPGSLMILCVFDTNDQLLRANDDGLRKIIKDKLASIGIDIKDIRRHVRFDTKQNCEKENNGRWSERLQ